MVIKNEKNYIFYRFSSPELPFAPGMSCLSAEKMKKKNPRTVDSFGKQHKTWIIAAIRKLLNVTSKS